MFGAGKSTFGGFGQSNNTTTPQQANQSFGGAFGNSASSGQTSSIFGQSQQGGVNTTTFGGFGTSSNPTQATSSFGGFGAATPQQQNTGSFGFGSNPSPAFGTPSGGLFGSTSQNTATPAFGSQPNTGLFGGTNSSNTSSFGNGNVFGGNNSQTVTNGSSNPPFSVFSEKEPAGSGTNHFQSITCMPAYSNVSFEELRVQDYNQNRRYGTASGMSGSFGSGAFAAGNNNNNTNNTNNNVFGSQQQTSTFGQSQPASMSTNSIFGQSTGQQTNAFGTTGNAANSFGQPQGSSLFGNSNTNTMGVQNNTGGSIFGAGNGTASTPFGSNNTTTATAFGSGNANPFGAQASSNSLFGSTPAVNSFGSNNGNNAKPFSFGASPVTGFGQTSNTGTPNAFGSTPTSNGASMFGQATTNVNSSGLFGQPTTGSTPGLNFGSTNPTNSGGTGTSFNFGNSSTPATTGTTQKPFSFGTPTNTTSTFGSTQNTANNKTFSFGNSNPVSSGNAGTGLFGAQSQNANNTSNNGSSSLFGGGGLFGSNNSTSVNNSSAMPGGGQAASATPNNLFGKGNTNIFGSTNATNPSSGLFSQPTVPSTQGQSLFGNSANNASTFQSMSQGPPPQNLALSIANNAYGNNPLFSSLQGSAVNSPGSPGPLATPLATASIKKKPAALPHFKIATRSPANSKFMTYKANTSLKTASPQSQRRHVVSAFDEELLLNPEAFSPRSNLKRLVIDREANDLQLFTGGVDVKGISSGPLTETDASKLILNTAKDQIPSTKQALTQDRPSSPANAKSSKQESPEQISQVVNKQNSGDGQTSKGAADDSYWTSPSLANLLDYSKAELSNVQEFKVGRRGFGQITFCVAVDLSSLERIEDLAGTLILFENKMCTVYPDESMKPPRGKGLNVPAIITLEKCFPLSKDKREPIRDAEHPRFLQHIDRLKKMSGTEFVDYLADTGTWIFKVEQF